MPTGKSAPLTLSSDASTGAVVAASVTGAGAGEVDLGEAASDELPHAAISPTAAMATSGRMKRIAVSPLLVNGYSTSLAQPLRRAMPHRVMIEPTGRAEGALNAASSSTGPSPSVRQSQRTACPARR